MSADKAEYMPLRATGDDADADPSAPVYSHRPLDYRSDGGITIPPLLFWACLGALAMTMLNVGLLPFTLSALQTKQDWTKTEPSYQPEVNIGLERAPNLLGAPQDFSSTLPFTYKNGTLVEFQFNFPQVLAHINRTDPEVAYTPPDGGRSTAVVITRADSMIMQFAVPDLTKPTCALVSFRPADEDMGGKTLETDGEIDTIEVWNVTAASEPLDAADITFTHRPPRGAYIGNLDMRRSPNSTTATFPCPMGGLQTVELKSQKWGCVIKFEQTFTLPMLGFELVQWVDEPS